MSDPQHHFNHADEAMHSVKHVSYNKVVPDDANIKRVQLISIRGGGGTGERQKRKWTNIAEDERHNSEKDLSPSHNESSTASETDKHIASSSSPNNITNRLRNRNHIELSSPHKPPPSSSNTTTTSHTTSTPPRMDGKSSSMASPGSHHQRQQPEESRDTGSKDPPSSGRIKQDISPAALSQGRQQQQQADATHQIRKEDAHRKILHNLESLCDHYSQDIAFAFLPSITTTTTKSRIDLSGSFLRSGQEESLDFFDLNDKGEIILQPRPPIFPEELASSGLKEHSLRWWGVEDPAVGDGRFKAPQQAPPGDDRSRQMIMMNDDNIYYQGGEKEYSNGHDRTYNAQDVHDPFGPPPPGAPPPYLDRSRGPDRRRDRR